MRILSTNTTTITCGIPGGMPGKFDVVVSVQGVGDATPVNDTADDFEYMLIIESIAPRTGYYYGGALVTITGKYFSTDIQENLVSIGD